MKKIFILALIVLLFNNKVYASKITKTYEVYINEKLTKTFEQYEEAVDYGKNHNNCLVKLKGKTNYLWDNYPSFIVYFDKDKYLEFDNYGEALKTAIDNGNSYIYYRKDNSIIYDSDQVLKNSHIIGDVPIIYQNPDLPRGCEITALTMLVNYKGEKIDKLTLAQKIKKDNSDYKIIDGITYFGNPNKGFVGDIYNLQKPGFGVYHKPIFELLEEYFPRRAVDLTGGNFDTILKFVSMDRPVWVIINNTYKLLPQNKFTKWMTDDGEINITYSEHSVVVTGFDNNFIYFNDPLGLRQFAVKEQFIEAWEQMGSQAVSVTD